MEMKKRVVIVGGGISGLSCAFDLCDKFDVTILERDITLGGQSRSMMSENVHLCYSWRIFTTSYKNLLHIFEHIPTPTGKVIDNFVFTSEYRTGDTSEESMKLFGFDLFSAPVGLCDKDKSEIISKFATLLTCSRDRLYYYDNTSFYDYMSPQSSGAKSYIDHIVGPFLGLEARKASVLQVVTMMNCVYAYARGIVPNGPYEEVIFKHWKTYLEKKGVNIKLNTNVLKVFEDGVLTNNERLYSDYIVLCVDQYALKSLNLSSQLNIDRINEFVENASQYYFSFELLLRQRVQFNPSVFTVKECEWLPIVERWNKYWKSEFIPTGFVEQWNIAVLDNEYNGRMMSDYSPEEIVHHTLEQIKKSAMLRDVNLKDGTSMWDSEMEVFVWPYWKYEDGKLKNTQRQYKISWNKCTFNLAPSVQTAFSNVIIGSVCAKQYPIVTQEAACFNGRTAATILLTRENLVTFKIKKPTESHFTLLPTRLIDYVLFKMRVNEVKYNEHTLVFTNILLLILFLIIVKIIVHCISRKILRSTMS